MFCIYKVATKGVVGLFNAIAETQHSKNESPSDEEGNINEKGSNNKSPTEVHHHHNHLGWWCDDYCSFINRSKCNGSEKSISICCLVVVYAT